MRSGEGQWWGEGSGLVRRSVRRSVRRDEEGW